MASAKGGGNVKVVCRIRPENKVEKESGCKPCVTFTDTSISIECAENGKSGKNSFSFDRIFGPNSLQIDVFNFAAKPVIQGVLNGFNGTIFAYGQTGSGKSWTMEGPSIEDDKNKGIIPRMMDTVFEGMMNASENIEFQIKVSYVEIYMEKIRDLIDNRKSNLEVKADRVKGIFIQDATEVYVSSHEEMLDVMKIGSNNRAVAATRMNGNSSRSHSVFILSIFQKDIKTDSTSTGKLYFCDLAGSEKVGKTDVKGQQLEEAKMINKSLTALGMVIKALTDKKITHVPYRDSKLTRLLQESLGGNSQTTLIITGTMNGYNAPETLSTFRFGNRAKSIQNKAKANVERSAKELLVDLEKAEDKIKKQNKLIAALQKKLEEIDPDAARDINLIALENLKEDAKEEEPEVKQIEETKDKGVEMADTETTETNPEKEELLTFEEEVTNSNEVSTTASTIVNDTTTTVEEEEASVAQKEIKQQEHHEEKTTAGSTMINLRQSIEIVTLNEDIQKLKKEKQEYDQTLSEKNAEIMELNERLLVMEDQTNRLQNTDASLIQELQFTLEKMLFEHQQKQLEISKLKTSLELLKCHFHLPPIQQLLRKADREDRGEDDYHRDLSSLLAKSVQDTLSIIDVLQQSIETTAKSASGLDTLLSPREPRLGALTSSQSSSLLGSNSMSSLVGVGSKNRSTNLNLNFTKEIGEGFDEEFTFSSEVTETSDDPLKMINRDTSGFIIDEEEDFGRYSESDDDINIDMVDIGGKDPVVDHEISPVKLQLGGSRKNTDNDIEATTEVEQDTLDVNNIPVNDGSELSDSSHEKLSQDPGSSSSSDSGDLIAITGKPGHHSDDEKAEEGVLLESKDKVANLSLSRSPLPAQSGGAPKLNLKGLAKTFKTDKDFKFTMSARGTREGVTREAIDRLFSQESASSAEDDDDEEDADEYINSLTQPANSKMTRTQTSIGDIRMPDPDRGTSRMRRAVSFVVKSDQQGEFGSSEKFKQVQGLVSDQRKSIDELAKENKKLKHDYDHANKEYINVVARMATLNEAIGKKDDQIKECQAMIDTLKADHEQKHEQLAEEKNQINDEVKLRDAKIKELSKRLKLERVEMDRLIKVDPNKKKLLEFEKKVKELSGERTSLFSEVMTLRKEAKLKDEQIKSCYDRISKLETQLILPNTRRPGQGSSSQKLGASNANEAHKRFVFPMEGAGKITPRINERGGFEKTASTSGPPSFFSRKAIKPIRGGGGNAEKFEQNNKISTPTGHDTRYKTFFGGVSANPTNRAADAVITNTLEQRMQKLQAQHSGRQRAQSKEGKGIFSSIKSLWK